MSKSTRSCPQCGSVLKIEDLRAAAPFSCSICGTRLRAPRVYARWIGLSSLLLPIVFFRLFGLTGIHWFYAVLLSWLPLEVLTLRYSKYLILPGVELLLQKETDLGTGTLFKR